MAAVLWIACITVLTFILSILFFPQLRVKGHTVKIYSLIPLVGGSLMLLCGGVSAKRLLSAFTENSTVNPIRILVLFLSMTIFSLILERTGFFEHISGIVLERSGHNQHRIFLSLYAIISILTIFTSNDIVILTFTPFICHFCRSAKVDPIPYLIMEFVAANTWSLFLLIGNPTNIYISGAFHISFGEYLRIMALPTVAAGICSLCIMLLLFRKRLHSPIQLSQGVPPITDRPLMWVALGHLAACVILLSLSQSIGFEMWLISLFMGISAVISSVICLWIRHKSLRVVGAAIGRMPYEIIPFIVGMFVMVLGLEACGFTHLIAEKLTAGGGVFSVGFLSFFSCNVLNNIPMSVLFSKFLNEGADMGQIYATIIGSNIGAFITPVGALAGIMWINLLKQNRVRLSTKRFVATGCAIGIPVMAASLAVLRFLV